MSLDPLPVVLSHFQVRPLVKAFDEGATEMETSIDLNRSTEVARLDGAGIHYQCGETLSWDGAAEIVDSENKCYALIDGTLQEIRFFSETTNWSRSLLPTRGAPTMLAAGIAMHRIVGTDPMQDTEQKIRAAQPSGQVLDTATGLGYTAIEAARRSEDVVTVEIDPAALDVARLNPWSRELFTNARIMQVVGHVWDYVEDSEAGAFSCIIHDPPMMNLAGELYSGDFYAELYRVLRNRGRLFHYIGDPKGRATDTITRGVIKRLYDAGFNRVVRKPRAYGVVAYK